MPKGVEHQIIGLAGRAEVLVPIPLMPKGVEHLLPGWQRWRPTYRVPIPLMPKGVEHETAEKLADQHWKVPIPLMPKGVEHLSAMFNESGIGKCPSI